MTTRQIVLMRHGEAEARLTSDAERALTSKGQQEVLATARKLAAMAVRPTRLVSSPYRRAQQTAELVRQTLCAAAPVPLLIDVLFLPEAEPALATEYLLALNEPCIIVTCHMPIVASLLYGLSREPRRWSFPTAGAVILSGDESALEIVDCVAPVL